MLKIWHLFPSLFSHRVVTDDCYPYRPPQQTPAEVGRCMMQSRSVGRGKRQATQRCPNTDNYHNNIYQSTPPYRLSSNVSTNTKQYIHKQTYVMHAYTPTHRSTPSHQFNTRPAQQEFVFLPACCHFHGPGSWIQDWDGWLKYNKELKNNQFCLELRLVWLYILDTQTL